jgi:hypothetical protein
MQKRSRMPRDANQLAYKVLQIAIGEDVPESDPDEGKNPAAVALGRLGGKKGGKARWAKLTAEQRSEAASIAAQARWRKKKH